MPKQEDGFMLHAHIQPRVTPGARKGVSREENGSCCLQLGWPPSVKESGSQNL